VINSSLPESTQNIKKSFNEMTFGELLKTLRQKNLDPLDLRTAGIELNKKLSIPLSCIVFMFLGLPLGIRTHRSVRSRGFTFGFLIVLIYYLLQLVGDALVETGWLSAMVGTWTPNLIFLSAGLVLFFVTAREIPFPGIRLHR
jgi:lipopolysaccharide export system permease protein